MAKITSIEYFRVLPRWLFVKVVDSAGNYGWGESTLEGHTEAVEGSLNELIIRFVGYEAEYVSLPRFVQLDNLMVLILTCHHSDIEHIWQTAWRLGFYRGGAVFMSAISGIDIALWDLKGTFYTFLSLSILHHHHRRRRPQPLNCVIVLFCLTFDVCFTRAHSASLG